jgi:serine/threonine protein kinase
MRNDSSSDVAASELESQAEAEDERSITAVAAAPAVTRERAPEVQPGDLLAGRYQIEALIGKGGSGVVLRAFDRVSATVVAVKVLKAGLTHDPRWEKRFQRELRLGRPVRHPNVCRIFDIGDADGYRFLTMEFATGGTLRDLIKKNQPLRPLDERLADAAGVIAGLAAIHGAGIVHRDVKPDNLLRMEDGHLVLSDFGLATDLPDSTMVSVFVGTPHYMAPEVREGDPATTRSDVWSLGVVLHEIFTGRRPERRNSRSGASSARGPITKSSSTIERAMLALSERCLADDPADRPADAAAVLEIFERARRSPYVVLKSSARRRVVSLAVGAVVVTAAVAVFALVAHRRNEKSHAPAKPAFTHLTPTGQPADWSKLAKVTATLPGRVHCFSMLDDDTVRVIWGAPRRVEDINIDTGARRVSSLVPEAYATGCPDLSPNRRELLFTANTTAGGNEIRHSVHPDGSEATPLTAGSDAVWLMNGEEFAFSIDSSHAAVFSLPTKRLRLLADPGLGGLQTILGKTASAHSEGLALMLYGSEVQWAIATYEGPGLNKTTTITVPGARNLRFGPTGQRLLLSTMEAQSPLAAFDWRAGRFHNMGRYSDVDLLDVLVSGERAALLGRHKITDVWLHDAAGKRRLTKDGDIATAAISPKNELLLAKPGSGTALNLWWRDPDGMPSKVTNGQFDTAPDFSPDGKSWLYVDYAQKSILVCQSATRRCRVLRRDEMLPSWPRFSPDGSRVAYVRQGAVARLIVLALSDGKEWPMGDTHWQCPPVWSSPDKIWGFEGSAGRYAWIERDVETRLRTGRRFEVRESQSAVNDDLDCWPEHVEVTSPFFRRLRVETEETSSILRLPRSGLVD